MFVTQRFENSRTIQYCLAIILFLLILPLAYAQTDKAAPSDESNIILSPYTVWRPYEKLNPTQQQDASRVQQQNPAPKEKIVSPESVLVPASNQIQEKSDAIPKDISIAQTDNLSREIIGEGDQLLVTVFGQPDLSADVLVGETGVVTLPLVGALTVKGKTPAEIAMMFATRLQQGQYVLNPKVSIKVQQQASRTISVLGEVQRPGRFPMQGRVTILDALSLAGGLTARADKGVTIVRKNGNEKEMLEYIPLKIDSDTHSMPEKLAQELLPNDVIFVPLQKTFYVHGEVRKPGIYPLEDDLTVMRVLSIGGGVTERGSLKRISIFRKAEDGSLKEISVNITDPVLPGDVVFVNERIF